MQINSISRASIFQILEDQHKNHISSMYLYFFPLLTLEKQLRNENLEVSFKN